MSLFFLNACRPQYLIKEPNYIFLYAILQNADLRFYLFNWLLSTVSIENPATCVCFANNYYVFIADNLQKIYLPLPYVPC